MSKTFEVAVVTGSGIVIHDMGWDGATEEDIRENIRNEFFVSVRPVFSCSSESDEDFCQSGVFVNIEEVLEEAQSSSGWVEFFAITKCEDFPDPNEAFEVELTHNCDWSVQVVAGSAEEAEELVLENLAKCFQLEEMDTAGYMSIESIRIESVS